MPINNKTTKLFKVILILVCLLALAGSGFFWYQSRAGVPANPDTDIVEAPPVFLTLKPFTVSLPTVRNDYQIDKVLYIGMILRIKDEAQKQVLTDYLPEVRSDLLLLLTKQDIDKLNLDTGKYELKELVKTTLSRKYDGKTLVDIDDVLFTDFIIR